MKPSCKKITLLVAFLMQLSMHAFNQPHLFNEFINNREFSYNENPGALYSSVTSGELYSHELMNENYDTILMALDSKGRIEHVKLGDTNNLYASPQKDEDRVLETLTNERKYTLMVVFSALASFLAFSVIIQRLRLRKRRAQAEADRFVAASQVHIEEFRKYCYDDKVHAGLDIFFKMHSGLVSGITELKHKIERVSILAEDRNVKEGLQDFNSYLSGAHIQASSRVHELGRQIKGDIDSLFLQKFESILQCGLPDTRCHKVVYVEKGVHANIPPDVKIAFLEISVEGIANIIKHTRAKHAEIMLTRDDNFYVLRINDSGKGFNARIKTPGKGFRSIYDKVKKYNGEFFVVSDKLGTSLKVVFPQQKQVFEN